MKIEALTVCVNYADFLAPVLAFNQKLFDRLLVVTANADKATQELCAKEKVDCLVTDAFYKGGKRFAKSAGINEGLAKLSCADWVCLFDSDTVLPPQTRQVLERAELDPACLYGIDRLMCPSWEAWAEYWPRVKNPELFFVETNHFKIGQRLAPFGRGGWVPLGFFQLWNPARSGIREYPHSPHAAKSDMQFAQRWPRGRRQLIPEIVAVHLESESAQSGANWLGRKTGEFGEGKMKAQGIPGWMSGGELTWLAARAAEHKEVVEIGCYKGRSTRALADATPGRVTAVDCWLPFKDRQWLLTGKEYAEFQRNVNDLLLSGKVTAWKLKSVQAVETFKDRKFDMVFIDADHAYESVRDDILAWRKLVRKGGLLCGHDYGHADWPGVKRAVDELLPNRQVHESIWWVKL
jgi:predicted O-methyltransferase YrrM